MKRLVFSALFLASSLGLHAQAVDATVCDILKNPQSFNNKIVRIKGTVAAGFDQFVIRGTGCNQHVNAIWLDYPEGTKGKAGPVAMLELQPAKNFTGAVAAVDRSPVALDRGKDFKQFDSLLSTAPKGAGMCLGCVRNTVTATLVGRLDGVADPALKRDAAGKIIAFGGFGHLNAYSARLVLQSVSEVSAQEIDYSQSALAAKGEKDAQEASTGIGAASSFATPFGPGNPLAAQIERSVKAYGAENDNNGVNISFGPANEASSKSAAKGDSDSPDGVLYNCLFDAGRVKGNPMARALLNLGSHIADLRNPPAGLDATSLYELEFRGWSTTVLGAIGSGQKTLTLPGGILLWNVAWAPAERDSKLNAAITSFLADQELLSR